MITVSQMFDEVLAFDRVSNCLRVVPLRDAEVLDAYGERIPDVVAFDLEAGWVDAQVRDASGALVLEGRWEWCLKPKVVRQHRRGLQLVVKRRVAEAKAVVA